MHTCEGLEIKLLLGAPALLSRAGGAVLPASSHAARLVAFLGVHHEERVGRDRLVDLLGLDRAADPRAALRKAVWQVNNSTEGRFLRGTRTDLGLADGVRVDYHDARERCLSLLRRGFTEVATADLPSRFRAQLESEVLGEFDEDWAAACRQEWQRLRLEVLHGLAEAELERGNARAALIHAEQVVRCDPLREGAWHTLLSALLASRHRAAAWRRFNELVDLLRDDLGVAPMFSWEELLEDSPRATVAGLRT
ncbi:hypothetical protein SUDANB15_04443 [Streptomyces sp. enrichment culture]|uniref:AfsR/SARP family transcriptional regulator n=1 Tax=Streptomyces sp. enrichment culture TaxID=1795815 RepID=UPI003F5553AD